MNTVAVVGLGAMGKPIAINLVKAGFRTTVWNRSPEAVQELASRGAVGTESLSEAFECDFVLSTLFDDEAVRRVFVESDVLRFAPSGTVHICMSTISTALADELVAAHKACGIDYVGAPVFGRPESAAAGKLNIVIAAAPHLIERVHPVLASLGTVWRVGHDPRLAYLAKIAGNFMVGCAVESMAESAALVSLHGGDPELFLSVMSETLFASQIHRSYGTAIATGKSPGSPLGLRVWRKDIRLMLDEAALLAIETPFGKALRDQIECAERKEIEHVDWSVALATVAQFQNL